MADKTKKVPQTVPGPWYVDEELCTPCRTCMEVAGADQIIKYNDDETKVYFHKQPEGPDELKIADETMAVCPQTAIAKSPVDRETILAALDEPTTSRGNP